MKIYSQIEQRTPEWFELRRGKITGTMLKRIVGTPKAKETAYYELLAERLTVQNLDEKEDPMARGSRLESEAVAEFEKKTKKKVEQVGFAESSFSKWAGYSPDGLVKSGKKYSEDIEIKCLDSKNHVRAWLTKEIPEEYFEQIVQGFIVNEDLERRNVVFYDPRISIKPYFVITIERESVEKEIADYKKAQIEMIKRIDDTLSKLVKF